eukprot:gb/GEZN01019640.1/.p1 GENE.gb/GEZN01019640.1/~~gb/GEZN01019640.1/.p1  ORF type:complete len:129 (-),score=8.02 gb/GEZN01019640.1/:303-689(-)
MISCQSLCRLLYVGYFVMGVVCVMGLDPFGMDFSKNDYRGTAFVKILGAQFLALSFLFMGISHTPSGRHYLLRYYGCAVVIAIPVIFFSCLAKEHLNLVYGALAFKAIVAVLSFLSVEPDPKIVKKQS